jgi:hypothetical protein
VAAYTGTVKEQRKSTAQAYLISAAFALGLPGVLLPLTGPAGSGSVRHCVGRHRLSVRTSPFQGGKTGSIPVGATKLAPCLRGFFFAPQRRVQNGCNDRSALKGPTARSRKPYALVPSMESSQCRASSTLLSRLGFR